MARRSANEGTIYRQGDRWIAMLELPRKPNGKRRRGLRRAKTKAEAQRLLREMRDELEKTGHVASAKRTVRDSVDSYMAKRPGSDQDLWAVSIILDGLGGIRLASLTVQNCDDFLEAVALGLGNRKPVGRAHLAKVRQALVAVLRNEMRIGNLVRNVAEISDMPVVEPDGTERRALSKDELRRLLDLATGSRLILIDLCGRNGLRPAEARALTWSAVDLGRLELSVGPQMSRTNELTGPKTDKATRTIMIDRKSAELLEGWREEQVDLRSRAASAWVERNIVASTARGGPVDRHSFARSMRVLCDRAQIEPRVTPYELRHTAISMQADAGLSSWEIADWAGTSEAMINQVYRHRLRRLSAVRPIRL